MSLESWSISQLSFSVYSSRFLELETSSPTSFYSSSRSARHAPVQPGVLFKVAIKQRELFA